MRKPDSGNPAQSNRSDHVEGRARPGTPYDRRARDGSRPRAQPRALGRTLRERHQAFAAVAVASRQSVSHARVSRVARRRRARRRTSPADRRDRRAGIAAPTARARRVARIGSVQRGTCAMGRNADRRARGRSCCAIYARTSRRCRRIGGTSPRSSFPRWRREQRSRRAVSDESTRGRAPG